MYVICDLKLCVNCIELGNRARQPSRGKNREASTTLGVKKVLVTSVDQKQGIWKTDIRVCAFYTPPAQVGARAVNKKLVRVFITRYSFRHVHIYAFSDYLFFSAY